MQRRRIPTASTQTHAAAGDPGAAPALAHTPSHAGHGGTSRAITLSLQDCRIAGNPRSGLDAAFDPLRRKPGNRHDEGAIEMLWHDRERDYLPCLDNAAAASLPDRTCELRGEILVVDDPDKGWEPIELRARIKAPEVLFWTALPLESYVSLSSPRPTS